VGVNPGDVLVDIGCGDLNSLLKVANMTFNGNALFGKVVGFDICPATIRTSTWCLHSCIDLLNDRGVDVALFQADVDRVDEFTSATHLFTFCGYPALIVSILIAILKTPTVRFLVLVSPYAIEQKLRSWGVTQYLKLPSMIMLDGGSHPGYVVPFSPEQRANIAKQLAQRQRARNVSLKKRDFNFEKAVDAFDEFKNWTTKRQELMESGHPVRKRHRTGGEYAYDDMRME